MEEQVSERMVIGASPSACYQILTDFERYPEWASDVKAVSVEQRDDDGRPVQVTFRAAAFGRSTLVHAALRLQRCPLQAVLGASTRGRDPEARRQLRDHARRRWFCRRHVPPRRRLEGASPRVREAAGGRQDHSYGAEGAQRASRALTPGNKRACRSTVAGTPCRPGTRW